PAPPAANQRTDRRQAAAERQKRSDEARPLKAELAKLEQRMAETTALRDRLMASIARPDMPQAERAEQGRRLKQAGEELEAIESRWLELGARLEALAGE
ncbi:MAG TPA: ABC transporter, partial [Burkholderiaceae bacterium]|nr:ABC transporter [Burkholderiaceae bacterium]